MQKDHPFYSYFSGTGNHEAAAILHAVDVLKQMNDTLQTIAILLVDKLDATHQKVESTHEKLESMQAPTRRKKNMAQAG